MICPKCKELGLKSIVHIGHGMTTCAYYQPYYDEEGIYHSHDGNLSTWQYSCSNGHQIIESGTGTCPSCDFGKDSKKITVKDIGTGTLNVEGTTGTVVTFKND